jgi:hypothetical protein
MALTRRGDGTGAAFQVSSAWWNDYYDLLTGAINDQPVSLYFAPGSASTSPALRLRAGTNATNILEAYNNANTKVLQLTVAGVLKDGSGTPYATVPGGAGPIHVAPAASPPTPAADYELWVKY